MVYASELFLDCCGIPMIITGLCVSVGATFYPTGGGTFDATLPPEETLKRGDSGEGFWRNFNCWVLWATVSDCGLSC